MSNPSHHGNGIRLCARIARTALALPIMIVTIILSAVPAQAQSYTYEVPYSFTGPPNAIGAFAGFALDAQGNFYGTSPQGGAFGLGTVFKIDAAGNETVLYNFTGTAGDGATPKGAVILDAQGNLYGTTSVGGDASCNSPTGCGTVFKLDPAGNETVLYAFTGANGDGANPDGDLVMDDEGNLFGTTTSGGGFLEGTVYKLTMSGVETVLTQVENVVAGPHGLVRDANGNLFGANYGSVFEVTKDLNGILLHFFGSPDDGEYPNARLVVDAQDNVYGTTIEGGYRFKHRSAGSGVVFKVDQRGNETLLHVFCMSGHNVAFCADGAFPNGGLVMDSGGNLYGTTAHGGLYGGNGTIFEIDPSGDEFSIYNFRKSKGTGQVPVTNLTMDANANMWGTTSEGGADYKGVMFAMLTPSASTTNTLSSTPNPSTTGEPVTFTAVVTCGAGSPPDGETVSFMKGKILLGTGALSGGFATFTTSSLKGKSSVTASYGGDPHLIASGSNVVVQVVKKAK